MEDKFKDYFYTGFTTDKQTTFMKQSINNSTDNNEKIIALLDEVYQAIKKEAKTETLIKLLEARNLLKLRDKDSSTKAMPTKNH